MKIISHKLPYLLMYISVKRNTPYIIFELFAIPSVKPEQ